MPRPSFGCSNCRARRIKCDERQNGCLNCELYGNVCPGYPERFDVLLRLHTSADTQPPIVAPAAGRSDTSLGLVSAQEYMPSVTTRVDPQLMHDPDSVALALYYSTNCIDGSTHYSLEQIRAQGNGCLFAAIKALNSIDVQKRWLVPDASRMLTESYQYAIQRLNLALTSDDEAKKDSTLMAVLIMSAIETKATPSATTAYWDAHTQGAAALLQIRGVEQVTTQLGSALFFQVSSQLITSCILAKRPVPGELTQLREAARVCVVDEEHTGWRFHGAMLHFADFLATSRDHNLSQEMASATIMEASSIYYELSSIFNNAGPEWQYRRLPSARYANLLDYEHSYNTVLATQHWNGYRIALISLCTIALRVDSQFRDQLMLSPGARFFLENAVSILNQTALDTIAAIPQALTMITSKSTLSNPTSPGTDICNRGHTSHRHVFYETGPGSQGLPYMHGYLLQWPVYFGAQSEFVEPRIRRCLWEILYTAGRTNQVKQWQILAEELRPEIERLDR